jgi:hypothetical protein
MIISMKQTDIHLQQVNQNIEPKTPNGCEECLQTGSDWVHLRLCLTCGISIQQNISKQPNILYKIF